MRLLQVAVLLVTTVLPAVAIAQSMEPKSRLPSGAELLGAFATICSAEAQGALLGFATRESGQSLESALARMPEPTDPALKSVYRGLRQTVEDMYEHRSIGYFAMFYYRSKACLRERTELKSMPSVAFSAAGLLRCERDHGTDGSPELLACVGRVVGAL